jgi:hypothetical protein
MFNDTKRPLLEFESTNYPDGKRKCIRITLGRAWISLIFIMLWIVLGFSGDKLVTSSWFLKLMRP